MPIHCFSFHLDIHIHSRTETTFRVEMTCWESCCSHRVRLGICLCIILSAFILDLIGFSIPYWYHDESAQLYAGLWKSCSEVGNVVTCVEWVDVDPPGNYH